MKTLIVVVMATVLLMISAEPAQPGQWEYSTDLGAPIEALSVIDGGETWAAVRSNGEVYRFDGVSWALMTELYPGGSGRNYGIYALDSEHIWVSGHIDSANEGQIYFGDGTNWYLQTQIAAPGWWIFDVYAADVSNVWAAGPAGNIYYSSNGGANWIIQSDLGLSYWFSIDGIDSQNVWVAGNDNPAQIAYYNGTAWSIETSFNTQTVGKYLRSISAATADQVWAAVEDGTVLQRQPGGEWAVSTALPEQGINEADISVYNAWNIGLIMDWNASGIYFYDGSDWTLQTDISQMTAIDYSHGPRVWAGDLYGQVYFQDISGSSGYRTDYDGDGTSDIAVYRETSGLWAVRGITRLYFGGSGDYPVPADYNGDGTTDPAIFRDWTGLWALRGISRIYFGASFDQARPGDFNGDGTDEPTIFRAYSGLWASRGVTRMYFGTDGDNARPGFYSGGPAMDIGIFRGNTGLWAVRGVTRLYFGGSSDVSYPGDYNGDGIWEAGIFRSSSGLWAIRGVTRRYFGTVNDDPVPAAYSGGPASEIGIFRDSSGLWAAAGVTRVYFGTDDDEPVTR